MSDPAADTIIKSCFDIMISCSFDTVQPSCTALMAATFESSFQALRVWCLLGLTLIAVGAELAFFCREGTSPARHIHPKE